MKIKLKRTILLLFFLLYSLFNLKAQSENGYPIIRNYTTKEYNGAPYIFGFLQDKRGIMYFGGNGEVIEYDGVSWQSIPIENKPYVYDLAIDSIGRIYVTAVGEFGYLTTDKVGNTIYKSLLHLIEDSTTKLGPVWSVNITSNAVYFQTYDAIFQYLPAKEQLNIFKADSLDRFNPGFVFKDEFYSLLTNKGLIKIKDKKLIPASQSHHFKSKNKFSTSIPYNSNTVLIPTRTEGIYLYQPNKDTIAKSFTLANPDFLEDNVIYNADVLLNDYYVLASIKKGALLIDKEGNTIQEYNEQRFLQANTIYKIASDASDNLWFGLSNGISKTQHSMDLSYWDKNSGLKGNVECLTRYKGIVYIGTNVGIYYIDPSNKIQEVKGIPASQIWCFLPDENSNSLLAGTQYGIFKIKDNKAVQLYKGSYALTLYQSKKNPYRMFCPDPPHVVSFIFKHGKWIPEGKWEGINDEIREIIEENNGDLWLRTYNNGVIKVTPDDNNITKPKNIKYYAKESGFESLKDINPFNYKDGIIWGTKTGLYKYNEHIDRFEPFCELGEPFCNGSRDINLFREMPDGKIWLSSEKNNDADIGYLQPNGNGGYDWVYAPFRRIPEMTVSVFYIDSSGIAWIGGSEGLYRYDICKDTKDYSQGFNCLIRKVTCGTDSLLYGGNAGIESSVLTYKNNSLKFSFAAPFFDHEEKTLYSYQLVGYEKEWSEWSLEPKKEYTNLHEGSYTFRVKARNIYDVESEIDSYAFKILPPWQRSLWAYTLFFFLSILFILFVIKLNTKRLVKQKENLEQIVKERTNELSTTLKIVNNQKEELSKLNADKNRFISILAHDLRSPFNAILGFLDILSMNKSKLDTNEAINHIDIINNSAKKTFNLLEDILTWGRANSGKIPYEPQKLNLKTICNEVVEYLQFTANTKAITINCYIENETPIFADKNMLNTVLRNLVSNAIKFTNTGGKIDIYAEQNQFEHTITVSDNGVGIEPEILSKLFDISEKVTTEGTENESGTGLGLLLCKEFIDKHKGKIWVESKAGKGSKFIFTIPLSN